MQHYAIYLESDGSVNCVSVKADTENDAIDVLGNVETRGKLVALVAPCDEAETRPDLYDAQGDEIAVAFR